MSRNTMIFLSVGFLMLALFACAGIGAYIYTTMPNQNLVNTQVAETIDIALTQTSQAQVPTMMPIVIPSATPPFTLTPELPAPFPTATATLPSPVYPPTPVIPLISVSVDTNCRVGPGKVYDRVGFLLVGQVSEVYGRNAAGDYWYIRNPNRNTEFCWLWGEYATVLGNVAALPIFTPPPTPTPVPNFEASYLGLDSCNGWWVDLKLVNTGGVGFTSLTLTVRDTVSNINQTLYSEDFTDYNGCAEAYAKDSLSPGINRIVSSPAFTYNPSGHLLRATITLCSNPGQIGTCVTQVIEFTP